MPDGNPTNLLYYGDNLDILRRYVKNQTANPSCIAPDNPRKSNKR